jgi:ribosomal-protein-alanine N-acetyltransferase
MNPKQQTYLSRIRWMIRRDMPEVLRIESQSFDYPWCDEDFLRCLRQLNCIGMVAETPEKVFGFMIYELHRTSINVLNFAVLPAVRRTGVGTQMTEKLAGKLSSHKYKRIIVNVRESNLDAQLFFRSQGYIAIGEIREYYQDTGESAYRMVYGLRA